MSPLFYTILITLQSTGLFIDSLDDSFYNNYQEELIDAQRLLQENEKVILNVCVSKKVDPIFVKSIVFPECSRYSRFKDFLETELIAVQYEMEGLSLVDFSVGAFQIKTSFAEQLENEVYLDEELRIKYPELNRFNSNNVNEIRKERLKRLSEGMLFSTLYVCAFIDLKLKQNKALKEEPKSVIVTTLATMYNRGIKTTITEVNDTKWSSSFPYGKRFEGPQVSYAALALNHYLQNI